jgi:thiol-disulfide isomerase/thioredoxin
MRKLICLLVAALMASELSAQTFPMPAIKGETLDGKKIDSAYFNGHLTLISFFYIGCPPCMKEIPVLNKLKDHFKSTSFQILAIAPHTPSVLTQFNKTPSGTREPISYDILPECSEDSFAGNSTSLPYDFKIIRSQCLSYRSIDKQKWRNSHDDRRFSHA